MKKFTWGHGVALALGIFICFILITIFFGAKILFPNGADNSELVTESYYEDELAYQKVIDAKNNADNLKVKPFFAQLPYGIRIVFPKEIIDANSRIEYYLYRTNDKTQDKSQKINLDNNNSFLIPKTELIPGSYTLKVSWKKSDKDYQVDYDIIWK